jgi:urease subunit alpha
VKPDIVLKCGTITAAAMGDPNASIPTPQPVHYRKMFGGFGRSLQQSRITFVSEAATQAGIADRLGLESKILPVTGVRAIGKKQMILNNAMPDISVDPETYEVRADGELLTCEPAEELPMAQRYFLF